MPEIKIQLEHVVRDAIRETLHAIYDTHGIQIDTIDAKWLDWSTPCEPHATLTSLQITTTQRAS